MAHGSTRSPEDLDLEFAGVVAETMQALATPSRVRILGRLHAGPCSVNELAESRMAISPVIGRTTGLMARITF